MSNHDTCKTNCGGTDCPAKRVVRDEPRIDLGRYAGTYGGYTTDPPKPRTLWQRFQAWRERTGFLMDGRDGGM